MKTNTYKMYGYYKQIIICRPLSKISLIGFLVFSFNNMFFQTESGQLKQDHSIIIYINSIEIHKKK
jgi:hypothetical protein